MRNDYQIQPSNGISDEKLCRLARQGDGPAMENLIRRYTRLVKTCARPYFLAGADAEDLMQEGMIALLSAIRTYRGDRGAAFRTYASRCISNGLAKVAASQLRARNIPLALTAPLDEAGNVSAPSQDEPEEIVIRQEQSRDRSHRMKAELSEYELACLQLLLDGCSYAEIAGRLGRTVKSVDRALGRARQKLRRALAEPV